MDASGTRATKRRSVRVEAARGGFGIAVGLLTVERDLLKSGELVQVLPGTVGDESRLTVVYPDREFLDPKVRAFVDFLVARVEESHRKAMHEGP